MDDYARKFLILKSNNHIFDPKKYYDLNEDLKHNQINTNPKLYHHFLEHGIREIRDYGDNNKELIHEYKKIIFYNQTNYYKADSVAFIITTCIRSKQHLEYLKYCLFSIRSVYPKHHIYVINDNSMDSFQIYNEIMIYNVQIIKSLKSKCGEVNPYLFILDSRCKHDKLIYIHDTVFLKKNIDSFIQSNNEIDFFWFSNTAIMNDTIRPENMEILNQMYFYFSNGKISLFDYFNLIKHKKFFNVKFGSMSIFTKRFMEKVRLNTNFFEIAHLFSMRVNRCFFERLLSVVYVFIYGNDYDLDKYICGNIMLHPNNFSNTNPNIPYDKPCVKVWQGR